MILTFLGFILSYMFLSDFMVTMVVEKLKLTYIYVCSLRITSFCVFDTYYIGMIMSSRFTRTSLVKTRFVQQVAEIRIAT